MQLGEQLRLGTLHAVVFRIGPSGSAYKSVAWQHWNTGYSAFGRRQDLPQHPGLTADKIKSYTAISKQVRLHRRLTADKIAVGLTTESGYVVNGHPVFRGFTKL